MTETTHDFSKPSGGVRGWLRQIFSIDPRSLAALRMALGLIILWEAFRDTTAFHQYFFDDGLLPSYLFSGGMQRWQSVFFISSNPAWTYAMFGMEMIFALMMIVGFRTRIATIGCFVMVWSVVNRNHFLANGGHNLLSWLLIWSIFLPLGAAASVDAITAKVVRKPVLTPATVGILLQLVYLYLVAGSVKLNPSWYSSLDAVHGFLRSHIGNPLGRMITLVPEFTAFLCVATLLLELLGPTLALVCGRHWLRSAIVLLFIGFHVGLATCLYITAFGWICIAAWLVVFPGSFWDFLDRFSWWNRISNSWNQFIQRLANVLSTSRWLVVHSMRLTLGLLPGAIVCGIILIVSILNLTNIFPKLERVIPGSGYKMKQVWKVMDVPWSTRTRLYVEADCKDGTTVTLVQPSPYALAPRWFDYLWSPERGAEVAAQARLTMITIAQKGDHPALLVYLTRLREQWNASHDASQKIVMLRAIKSSSTIARPEARTLQDRAAVRTVFYEWVDNGEPNGRFTYHDPN